MGSSTGAQDTFQKDVQKPTMLGTQPPSDGSLSSPGGVTPSQRQRATVRVHGPQPAGPVRLRGARLPQAPEPPPRQHPLQARGRRALHCPPPGPG